MGVNYRKSTIILDLLYGFFLLLFTIWISFWVIRKSILEWDEISLFKVVFSYTFILLFIFITYKYLGLGVIRRKYYLLNKIFSIEFDTKKSQIIITDKRNNKLKIIDFEDIKAVELYYSWNTTPFSSDLGYSKLILRNDSIIIITQNNVNQYIISKALKSKVILNKSRFSNNFSIKQLLN